MTDTTKLELPEGRVSVPIADARTTALKILELAGCSEKIAGEVVDHLIDADLCGPATGSIGVKGRGALRSRHCASCHPD